MSRAFWINAAVLMVRPILQAIVDGKFKDAFPPDSITPNRRPLAHLEALSRSLLGVAPFLELQQDTAAKELAPLARRAITLAVDPKSSQYMMWDDRLRTRQPLFDSGLLVLAFLRAPRELWGKLNETAKANVLAALQLQRKIVPYENNWVLTASLVELMFLQEGKPFNETRLMEGITKHRKWYVGDGAYADGPVFEHGYYNSYDQHPFMYGILKALLANGTRLGKQLSDGGASLPDHWRFETTALARYVEVQQEAIIAPDGSFSAIGRSITYRCGAFHAMALAALERILPRSLTAGQVRVALTRAINRTLDARAYDTNGWLRIGMIGEQRNLGEPYINTGSLYMASVVFLPLGRPSTDTFWTAPDAPTSWEKIWITRRR